jgi:hypothetical protein
MTSSALILTRLLSSAGQVMDQSSTLLTAQLLFLEGEC